eukprot:scaffold1954_cov268-Pinguiococcus_pyrenoidosus.AAC.104
MDGQCGYVFANGNLMINVEFESLKTLHRWYHWRELPRRFKLLASRLPLLIGRCVLNYKQSGVALIHSPLMYRSQRVLSV